MTPSVLPRIRSEAVWNRARDACLAGETAAGVCVRFGLGLSTFRARARRCGWRRADQLDPDSADSADSNFRRESPESRESTPSPDGAAPPQPSLRDWQAGIAATADQERARLRAMCGQWD